MALYRDYFVASFSTLTTLSGDLDRFPRPELAMMLTSLLLAILPTAVISMFALSVAQSRSRVNQAEQRIRERHHQTITHLQDDGVLRLRWDDPLLSDAEFLLSVGAADYDERS